jgi:hypothetical protein
MLSSERRKRYKIIRKYRKQKQKSHREFIKSLDKLLKTTPAKSLRLHIQGMQDYRQVYLWDLIKHLEKKYKTRLHKSYIVMKSNYHPHPTNVFLLEGMIGVEVDLTGERFREPYLPIHFLKNEFDVEGPQGAPWYDFKGITFDISSLGAIPLVKDFISPWEIFNILHPNMQGEINDTYYDRFTEQMLS